MFEIDYNPLLPLNTNNAAVYQQLQLELDIRECASRIVEDYHCGQDINDYDYLCGIGFFDFDLEIQEVIIKIVNAEVRHYRPF